MITVREATRDDAAFIVQSNQAMALETENKTLEDNVIAPGVEKIFAEPDLGFYLIAETEGIRIATLMITTEWSDWRNGLFWWIQSVYVDPEHRRSGAFRTLYESVRERAQQAKGICGLRLYVEKENLRAQATYHRMGMAETHYRLFEEEF